MSAAVYTSANDFGRTVLVGGDAKAVSCKRGARLFYAKIGADLGQDSVDFGR